MAKKLTKGMSKKFKNSKPIQKKVTPKVFNKNHPGYRQMIIRTIKMLLADGDKYTQFSSSLIRKSMIDFFNLDQANMKRIRRITKLVFNNLVNSHALAKNKESYRFTAKYFKSLKRKGTAKRRKLRVQKQKSKGKKLDGGSFISSLSTSLAPSAPKIPNSVNVSNPFARNLHYNTTYANATNINEIPKAVWQYYDNNKVTNLVRADGWYDYDQKASDLVEEEWQKYIKNRAMCDVRAVKSGEFSYMVDFINWKQTNIIHHAHTQRRIRRLDERGQITKNPYESN